MAGQEEIINELGEKKTRELAGLIYYQEVNRINTVPFKSEFHRGQYLRDCFDTYHAALHLLDDKHYLPPPQLATTPASLVPPWQPATTPSNDEDENDSLAHDIFDYVRRGVSVALACLITVYTRKRYLDKLGEHRDSLLRRRKLLDDLSPAEREAAERALIQEVVTCKNAQLQMWRQHVIPPIKVVSLLRKGPGGYTFRELVSEAHEELIRVRGSAYDKPFDDLEVSQKIEVYEEIYKNYGQGGPIVDKLEIVADAFGKAILLLTVAVMVWDIATSKNKWYTTAHDVSVLGGSLVGGAMGGKLGIMIATSTVTNTANFAESMIGVRLPTTMASSAVTSTEVSFTAATATEEAGVGISIATETVVASAATEELVSAFAIAATASVCVAGIVTGFAVGLALGAFAGWLIDRFFETGGKNHVEKDIPVIKKHLSAQSLHHYVAPMPDGAFLARQLTAKYQA